MFVSNSFLFLVLRPGAPSSVLVTTSKALVTSSDALVSNSFLKMLLSQNPGHWTSVPLLERTTDWDKTSCHVDVDSSTGLQPKSDGLQPRRSTHELVSLPRVS